MTQEERNWLYDTAYRLDSLRRFSWSELANAIKCRRVKGRGHIVVMNGDVLEQIAEKIRDVAQRDGSRLISQAKTG